MRSIIKLKEVGRMKFSVGYNSRYPDSVIDAVNKCREKIGEVYFAYSGFANGRKVDESAERLESDLKKLDGIPLNILFNAMCYGEDALSREFFNNIGNTVDRLKGIADLKTVTTTSPLIAKFIKQNFADINVRASVNMEIGTVEGMEYIAENFDSFYAKRECNKNFSALKKLRKWCDENGKQLYGLSNSGCLNFCSAHTFHDNLVAHENGIAFKDNAYNFEGQCAEFLKNGKFREKWLSRTNFIRPEDITLYEEFFDGIKLATRITKSPTRIIEAYTSGSFSGNLPELLEPNHSALFYPYVVENKKVEEDFAFKTANCDKNCSECGYCEKVFNNAVVNLEGV